MLKHCNGFQRGSRERRQSHCQRFCHGILGSDQERSSCTLVATKSRKEAELVETTRRFQAIPVHGV